MRVIDEFASLQPPSPNALEKRVEKGIFIIILQTVMS